MADFKNLLKTIDTLEDEEVWDLYAHVSSMLKERGLVRTRNIVGERGEFLAIKIYNGVPGLAKLQVAPNGTQNCDALSRKGDRYSIKTISEPSNCTGVFHGCGDQNEKNPQRAFEYVTIVIIDKAYRPKKILELTWNQFLKFRKWHKTMRAWNITVTQDLLKEVKVIYPS
jgi:hypothetical protein